MNALVLQIVGKKSKSEYNESEYIIEDKSYTSYLSSEALELWLKDQGKNVERILLAPESLACEVAENPSELNGLLSNHSLLRKELEASYGCKVLITQSVGLYKKREKIAVKFNNFYDNLLTYFFLDLLDIAKDKDELFLDVSTGLNYYVVTSLEAVRRYLVFRKLRNIIKGKGDIKVYLVYVPPFIAKTHVERQELDVKAFFETPFKEGPKGVASIGKMIKIEDMLIEEVKRTDEFKYMRMNHPALISSLHLAYSAIVNNTPLAMFYPEVVGIGKETKKQIEDSFKCIKNFLNMLETKYKKIERKEDGVELSRLHVDGNYFTNVLFSLNLFESIVDFWSEHISSFVGKPRLDVIEEKFPQLYENLGRNLNTRFLERDIKEIKEVIERSGLKDGCWKRLSDLLEPKGPKTEQEKDEKSKEGDMKRNFFAHSGFLRNFVMICKKENEIYVEYDKNELNTIKGWLSKP